MSPNPSTGFHFASNIFPIHSAPFLHLFTHFLSFSACYSASTPIPTFSLCFCHLSTLLLLWNMSPMLQHTSDTVFYHYWAFCSLPLISYHSYILTSVCIYVPAPMYVPLAWISTTVFMSVHFFFLPISWNKSTVYNKGATHKLKLCSFPLPYLVIFPHFRHSSIHHLPLTDDVTCPVTSRQI